jgi:hypothetical protein
MKKIGIGLVCLCLLVSLPGCIAFIAAVPVVAVYQTAYASKNCPECIRTGSIGGMGDCIRVYKGAPEGEALMEVGTSVNGR